MLRRVIEETAERERMLAEAMRELATDLRMIDVVEFVSYIRMEKFGHVETLINSAAELYFKPGVLSFGASADVKLTWLTSPVVSLDMEFKAEAVRVYFSLTLEDERAGVEINFLSFEEPEDCPAENTRRFGAALRNARRQ